MSFLMSLWMYKGLGQSLLWEQPFPPNSPGALTLAGYRGLVFEWVIREGMTPDEVGRLLQGSRAGWFLGTGTEVYEEYGLAVTYGPGPNWRPRVKEVRRVDPWSYCPR